MLFYSKGSFELCLTCNLQLGRPGDDGADLLGLCHALVQALIRPSGPGVLHRGEVEGAVGKKPPRRTKRIKLELC